MGRDDATRMIRNGSFRAQCRGNGSGQFRKPRATAPARRRAPRPPVSRRPRASVKIENRTAVEITPRPDLVPFFAALALESSNVMTYGRKRRGSVSSPRHDTVDTEPIDIGVVPPRLLSGKPQRSRREF